MKTTIHGVAVATRKGAVADYSRFVCCMLAVILMSTCKIAWGDGALDRQISLDIPANMSLEDALIEWGTKVGMTVMINTPTVDGHRAQRIKGTLSARKALLLLLQNSGLSYMEDGTTIRVVPAETSWRVRSSDMPLGYVAGDPPSQALSPDETGDKASGDEGRGAGNSTARAKGLEEVVVTAQKRSENLIDVPVSISAISGGQLESLHVQSLSDLAGYVPGLSITSSGAPGFRYVTLRGFAVGVTQAGPLVGTYIDDMPVGSSTSAGRGLLIGLDLMPYDVEDVEVLKGPQGTLYGSNAMSGLIKYSLRKPDLTQFDARIGADVSYVNDSGGPDRTFRGAVNMPILTDKLAVRVSGFYNDTAGYVDNVGTGTNDANHSTEGGGRVALRWQATDKLSLQLSALAQEIDASDLSIVTVSGTTLQPLYGPQKSFSYFPQLFKQNTRAYDLTALWTLDFATLSSTTGWSHVSSRINQDDSIPFASYVGYPGAINLYEFSPAASKFVEETRLTSPDNQRLQWVLGGYYTREIDEEHDNWPAFTSSYVPLPPQYNELISNDEAVYKEAAAFANLTFKITNGFDIGGGARYASYTLDDCKSSTGLFGTGFPSCSTPPAKGVSVWMGNVSYHLDRDAMLYAHISTGFRPGALNFQNTIGGRIPPLSSNSDRTTNYEVGFKGQVLDHRLQFETAIFDIEWKDIQTMVNPSGTFSYIGNAGTAVSRGFELSSNYQVIEGLRFSATLAFTDAHLTQDPPPGVPGKNGDQIPQSVRWSGSLAADYNCPLNERMSLMVGGSYRYKDGITNLYPDTPGAPPAHPTEPFNPQNIVDLYTGIRIEKVTLRLYGRNVFNDRSYDGLEYSPNPQALQYVPIQPRTIGLSVDYQF